MNPGTCAVDKETMKSIADRYFAGEKSTDLAKEFYVEKCAITCWVRKVYPGRPLSYRMGGRTMDIDLIQRIYSMYLERKFSQKVIAEKLKTNQQIVSNAITLMRIKDSLEEKRKTRYERIGVLEYVFCPTCDHQVGWFDNYCGNCGQRIEVWHP